jgi:hypothetical protein
MFEIILGIIFLFSGETGETGETGEISKCTPVINGLSKSNNDLRGKINN